jgi:phage-related protein
VPQKAQNKRWALALRDVFWNLSLSPQAAMEWQVEVLNDTVRSELNALPWEIRGHLIRLERMISQVGLENLREPYVKHLEGKLWEMRVTGRDGIARAIYITAKGRRVVILRAFIKKTQQTPRSEIDLAQRRAKEIL